MCRTSIYPIKHITKVAFPLASKCDRIRLETIFKERHHFEIRPDSNNESTAAGDVASRASETRRRKPSLARPKRACESSSVANNEEAREEKLIPTANRRSDSCSGYDSSSSMSSGEPMNTELSEKVFLSKTSVEAMFNDEDESMSSTPDLLKLRRSKSFDDENLADESWSAWMADSTSLGAIPLRVRLEMCKVPSARMNPLPKIESYFLTSFPSATDLTIPMSNLRLKRESWQLSREDMKSPESNVYQTPPVQDRDLNTPTTPSHESKIHYFPVDVPANLLLPTFLD